ncbi:very short patch repair endonuclease [Maricaulis maris]|uniref:very short patch repair endonuclease n=1 Tax=Maricaulis maris TaxID=74318 RepID=UPI003A913C8B
MPDVVDSATRSRMMAGIKAKNTKPEMLVRRGLHAMGFRYRLHDKRLPGKPDLVLPKYRSVIFVHGCFWHGHDCPAFKWPKTREKFWREKILTNRKRDEKQISDLVRSGWRVSVVWECALRSKTPDKVETTLKLLASWIEQREIAAEKSDDPTPFEVFPGSGDKDARCR